jgi:hypothetical protein
MAETMIKAKRSIVKTLFALFPIEGRTKIIEKDSVTSVIIGGNEAKNQSGY